MVWYFVSDNVKVVTSLILVMLILGFAGTVTMVAFNMLLWNCLCNRLIHVFSCCQYCLWMFVGIE